MQKINDLTVRCVIQFILLVYNVVQGVFMLKAVLLDEKERLRALMGKLSNKLKPYQKGSYSIRKRGNKEYAYRVYRMGDEVNVEYIGKVDSQKSIEFKQMVEERRELEGRLKNAKSQMKEIERALRGFKL